MNITEDHKENSGPIKSSTASRIIELCASSSSTTKVRWRLLRFSGLNSSGKAFSFSSILSLTINASASDMTRIGAMKPSS